MKKYLLFIFFAMAFSAKDAVSQNLSSITKALSDGNADVLGLHFDNSVEVAILEKEEVYAKADAVRAVREFFNKNKTSSFSQMHQGASKGQDSQFVIGNLITANGTFRVYVYMKVSGGKYLVQELRFDKG